jgi:hypothetical protein
MSDDDLIDVVDNAVRKLKQARPMKAKEVLELEGIFLPVNSHTLP